MHAPSQNILAEEVGIILHLLLNKLYYVYNAILLKFIPQIRKNSMVTHADNNLNYLREIIVNWDEQKLKQIGFNKDIIKYFKRLKLDRNAYVGYTDEFTLLSSMSLELERLYKFKKFTKFDKSVWLVKNYIDEVNPSKIVFEISMNTADNDVRTILIYFIPNTALARETFLDEFRLVEDVEVDAIGDSITVVAPIISTDFDHIAQKISLVGSVKFEDITYDAWAMNTSNSIYYKVD